MEPNSKYPESCSQDSVEGIFAQQYERLCRGNDRMFAALMILQWIVGVVTAMFYSPQTWIGATPSVHLHVWAALLLGGAISSLPVYLGWKHPGRPITRHVIAIAQVLWSALLIHMTGGRIETHFHVFVSLAFLSLYRDWRLLIIPSLIVALDHAVRGFWWPQSVYGIYLESPFRWVEHTVWVVFEVIVLSFGCQRSRAQMRSLSRRQEQLESLNLMIEDKVRERTHELSVSEEKLRVSESRLQTMLDSTLDPMITFNDLGIIQTASHSVESVLGWMPEALIGESVEVLLPEPQKSQHSENLGKYRREGSLNIVGQTRESPVVHRNGTILQCNITLWKVEMPHSSDTVFMSVIRDITERKRLIEQLEERAYSDALTGLPNRASILDSIQSSIDRRSDCLHALLFLDFDGFKLINDSLGHELGDELLIQIASRLREGLRTGDEGQTARLGGDEFVVLLQGIADPADAIAVAERLLDLTSQSYSLSGHRVFSSASIGIVTTEGQQYTTASEMLRDADLAMYDAKMSGKGCYSVFDQGMRDRVQAQLCIENELRDAIMRREFVLAYQPIMSLETGRIEAVEALIRWRHPLRGLLSPAEFLDLAEETELILPIEDWTINEACRQLSEWHHELGNAAPPRMNVNISPRRLLLPNLVTSIADTLARHSLPAHCLHLEINENGIMRDPRGVTKKLNELRELGVKIAIDDFGTGCSSLSCLHEVPLDVLKIDRGFISDASLGRNFAALLHAIVTLAEHLDLQVVAEGIETPDQLSILQALGCHLGQGFFFAKPMLSEQLEGFLASRSDVSRSPYVNLENTFPAPEADTWFI